MQTKHDHHNVQLSSAYLQPQGHGVMGVHFAAIKVANHIALLFSIPSVCLSLTKI